MKRIWPCAIIVLMAIASITNGAIQEACATLVYLGIGAAIIQLYWEQSASRRSPP